MELESSIKDRNGANRVAFWCFHGCQANVVWFFNFGWKRVFDIAMAATEMYREWVYCQGAATEMYREWVYCRGAATAQGSAKAPSDSSSSSKISGILSGRLSVDGSDFYRKNYEPESDSFTDTFDWDSKSSKMDSTTTGKSLASSCSACGGSIASSSGGVGGFLY
ncbi:hypothetical protein FH972_019517 [Carpinus fangiana]|uniref:Uncharacterized protein n=1 Tax=Carpinus fangiana TaxID=176857 RepID=A0A5N6RQW0_9ROSI|nr:hypothetical protein FH972_019517 [Carpinus fangiana]